MSEACAGGGDGGAIRRAPLGLADWLSLGAAPTFATMALLTGVQGGEPLNVLCGPTHGVSLLGGMAPMYLLMSAFHSAAWLKLMSRGRSGVARP